MATAMVVRQYHRTAEEISPLARATDIIRGVTMTLEATAPETTRIRFEVCGSDVTQIPRGFPLALSFDTAIRQVEVTTNQAAMVMQTATAAQQVTVALTRDPFLVPDAWRIAVLIDFARRPGQGWLTLSDGRVQAIPLPTGAATETQVVFGTPCDEAYAAARP
jgi:hypothetical protein